MQIGLMIMMFYGAGDDDDDGELKTSCISFSCSLD